MMEKYFQSPQEFKSRQERPQLHYQVGVTPERVEVPRSLVDEEMQEKVKVMPKEHQPHTPVGPDLKWVDTSGELVLDLQTLVFQSQLYLTVFLIGKKPWIPGDTR
ncbi:hypothetical protein K1719_020796 [Acacia pycnantha]|nr:hypothetical protein K1719_020796 [Acacia pycnantha]